MESTPLTFKKLPFSFYDMHLYPPVLVTISLAAFLAACSPSKDSDASADKRPPPAVPVVAATVEQKAVPVQLMAIGNVRAKSTVAVKPRVTGQIAKVFFNEGEDVKEGDILAKLDPAPFEVVLAQAKARLAQAQTQADIAKKQADRYANLSQSGGVSREEVDNFKSSADAARSNTEAAAAMVKEAELQLSFCTVLSPITGRAGRRAVDAGNVVKADETDLVVINQLRPIEVIFSVPEQHFTDIQSYMSRGELKVTITPSGSTAKEIPGVLSFVDNAIKPTTGTLEVKATMPNEDLALWPGQYGEIALTLTTQADAIVAPATAVQTGQNGQYVFLVTADNTVEMQPVELDRTLGTMAIIRKGLKKGDVVVIDGQLRLIPGSRVEIKPPVGVVPQAEEAEGKLSHAEIP
ncbi:multidrug efflux system membrane fusion protein [Prosthecobacter fusiformis]|uniref:Multidrug efflux system membrane fusion protein n=1 Tax=Prosthecobacter fusiformis TaxID=48464 RepID=A0A4R7RLN5_9BACT|nr:efflux RND transporter periplasmic adaptor subunit [Prosthecobacter fusiformis]TDU64575.1 multidrug efflux system membrane fusion protein [Prosthecobacter fusiformis]